MSAIIFRCILRYNSLLLIKCQCYNIALVTSKKKNLKRDYEIMKYNQDRRFQGLQGNRF